MGLPWGMAAVGPHTAAHQNTFVDCKPESQHPHAQSRTISEFLLDILDVGGMGGDNNVSGGVPIPRNPRQTQHHHFPDLGNMGLNIQDCHSPQQPQTPSNSFANSWDGSNVMIHNIQLQDNNTGGFSPATSYSPALWQTHSLDMDLDIKLEPLDDLLGVDDFLQHTNYSSMQTADSQLLDDVNLDDLLMPGEHLENNAMDQQPSSPMTMITVHPDDVINFRGHNNNNNNNRSSSSSLFQTTTTPPQPVKAESSSLYSLLASSFPPQGQTWRDPLLTSSSLPAHQANSPLTSIEEYPTINQQQLHGSQGSFHQSQTNFSSSHSNNGSTSALQELLLRSPSTTLSSTPISPCPLSPTPLSPHRHTSSPQMAASPQLQDSFLGQSVPRHSSLSAANPQLSARLSSSAPTHNFLEQQKWMRREPRQHLLSTGSMAEELGGSASSISTGGIMSPGAHDLSIDEGIDSDDDSDNEKYDSDSDNDSNISEEPGSLSGSMKKERFFWQYNVQAKGPKGQKVTIQHNQKDPYSLPQVMDPVFSPMCSLQGIKHSGKARRGDGNDLTPNPRKLVSIGRELEKLSKVINDMTPVSELPFNIRPKSRKEKNKLASRACRLKKKAQHEANKIKLYGLQHEHRSLMSTIDEARKALVGKIDFRQSGQSTGEGSGGGMGGMSGNTMALSPGGFYSQPTPGPSSPNGYDIEKIAKSKKNAHIAGNTTLFVNKVIENTQNGNQTGGLEDLTLNFSNTKLATSPNTTTGMGGFVPM